jgi:glycosyltransferase involved in cell wall biosynthesis
MSLLNLITSLSFSLGAALVLFKKRREYDLVHFHGASLPLILNIVFLKIYKKKVIAKVAAAKLGTEAGSLQGRYSLLGKILIWMLKKVDCFIATSEEIKEGLLKDGFDKDKIVKIPNFIDRSTFYPSDEQSKAQIKNKLGLSNTRVVTFSGRLVERKGAEILLEAWSRLMRDHQDIVLLILGGGPLEKKLKQQSRILGIEACVKFCGFVNNIRDYLAVTDVFVCPSFQEGFPNSVLESMACGLPVIGTKIGGVVDVIKDGENGLLVDAGDIDQLANAMKKLLSDGEYALALGENALKTITRHYDLNMISSKYVELYRTLMEH